MGRLSATRRVVHRADKSKADEHPVPPASTRTSPPPPLVLPSRAAVSCTRCRTLRPRVQESTARTDRATLLPMTDPRGAVHGWRMRGSGRLTGEARYPDADTDPFADTDAAPDRRRGRAPFRRGRPGGRLSASPRRRGGAMDPGDGRSVRAPPGVGRVHTDRTAPTARPGGRPAPCTRRGRLAFRRGRSVSSGVRAVDSCSRGRKGRQRVQERAARADRADPRDHQLTGSALPSS